MIAPRLVWRVFMRNLTVYKKTWMVSISFNFVEPLLYLAALGVGLGNYVQPIRGIPYLHYLAPGLVASSAVFATAYECTYGTYIRMEFQKTYHAIIATPASIEDAIVGDMLFGAFKSFLYGTVILMVVTALGLVTSKMAFLLPPVLAVSGIFFAAFSMTWTGLVPNIDSFNYFFSMIMTPLFLFSGVFFPLDDMPYVLRQVVWLSPLYHLVNLARGLTTGYADMSLAGEAAWLLVAAALLLPVPVFLVRRLIIK